MRHHPDVLRAINEDAIAIEQRLDVLDRLGQTLVDEVAHHFLEDLIIGDLTHRPPHPRPVGVKALPGDVIEDVVDELALVEAIEERGESPQVHARGSHAEQVVLDASEFGQDRAHHLALGSDIDVEEFFHRAVPGDVVDNGTVVVHAAYGADILVVVVMLAELLEAAVEVSDVGDGPHDPLAVQFKDDTEGGVGGRVLGTKIEYPPIRGLNMILEILGGLDIEVVALIGLEGIGHGEGTGDSGPGSSKTVSRSDLPDVGEANGS